MTPEEVRAIFFEKYSGNNLNEALAATSEEATKTLIKESVGTSRAIPEIVWAIAAAKNRLAFFGRLVNGMTISVSSAYFAHLDFIRKTMADAVRYMRANLETADPWFREQFSEEDLDLRSAELARSLEEAAGRPVNVRAFHTEELAFYGEFFTSALIGILGMGWFEKYATDYNVCAVTLRQCQAECKLLKTASIIKE